MFGNTPLLRRRNSITRPRLPNFPNGPTALRFKIRVLTDVRMHLGTLLVSLGYEISQSFIDRVRNFGPGLPEERVRVQLSQPMPNYCDSSHQYRSES
jgi:hypothetical protein